MDLKIVYICMSYDFIFNKRIMKGYITLKAKFVHRIGGTEASDFSPMSLRWTRVNGCYLKHSPLI